MLPRLTIRDCVDLHVIQLSLINMSTDPNLNGTLLAGAALNIAKYINHNISEIHYHSSESDPIENTDQILQIIADLGKTLQELT